MTVDVAAALAGLDDGKPITLHDAKTARTLTVSLYREEAYLKIHGKGIPRPISVYCPGDHYAIIAKLLFTGCID